MGALHDGHLSLLPVARQGCDLVVVSIFVNPTQFGPQEDWSRYPRDLDRDLQLLERAGCDLVFAPEAADMYAADARTRVEVRELDAVLCGASRPGHFSGVATVVAKLFHLLRPHVAVFGQKDAQQAVLLRRMVRDLDFDVELRIAPIVRDADGLALSSRNRYLSRSERQEALLLSRALEAVQQLAAAGERHPDAWRRRAREVLEQGENVRLDYVDVVDPRSLKSLTRPSPAALVAIAARVGTTRLIDNRVLQCQDETMQEVGLQDVWQGEERA
jgi:pantoate--beta-alanine ligase